MKQQLVFKGGGKITTAEYIKDKNMRYGELRFKGGGRIKNVRLIDYFKQEDKDSSDSDSGSGSSSGKFKPIDQILTNYSILKIKSSEKTAEGFNLYEFYDNYYQDIFINSYTLDEMGLLTKPYNNILSIDSLSPDSIRFYKSIQINLIDSHLKPINNIKIGMWGLRETNTGKCYIAIPNNIDTTSLQNIGFHYTPNKISLYAKI